MNWLLSITYQLSLLITLIGIYTPQGRAYQRLIDTARPSPLDDDACFLAFNRCAFRDRDMPYTLFTQKLTLFALNEEKVVRERKNSMTRQERERCERNIAGQQLRRKPLCANF